MLEFIVLGYIPGTSYRITVTWVVVTAWIIVASIVLYMTIRRISKLKLQRFTVIKRLLINLYWHNALAK